MLITTKGLGRPGLGIASSGLGRFQVTVAAAYVRQGGEWIPLTSLYVRHSGEWKTILQVHDANQGSWRQAL